MQIAGRKIKSTSVQIDGVDSSDYPDFCDAYFCYAEFEDGEKLTDVELEELTDVFGDVINMMAFESMQGSAEDRYDYLNDR